MKLNTFCWLIFQMKFKLDYHSISGSELIEQGSENTKITNRSQEYTLG